MKLPFFFKGSINVTFLLLLLSGCASMSEQECLTANWLDKGYRDGRNGLPLTLLAEHREACAKVGVVPDNTLYLRGRDRGIVEYCTPENARHEGRLGRSYRNACPAHLERNFLRNYEDAKRVYDAEQEVDRLNRRSSELERALRKEKDDSKRQYLRRDLRELDRDLNRARDNVRYEERRLR